MIQVSYSNCNGNNPQTCKEGHHSNLGIMKMKSALEVGYSVRYVYRPIMFLKCSVKIHGIIRCKDIYLENYTLVVTVTIILKCGKFVVGV